MATEEDWKTEYLGPMISIKVVQSLEEAISHINTYGSGHTDSIVTENITNSEKFLKEVDSSSVMVNTSTRFADGFEYGLEQKLGLVLINYMQRSSWFRGFDNKKMDCNRKWTNQRMTKLIKVITPDIGDFKDVPIIELLIKDGDIVEIDQPLITIESDKATMEIPSTHSGVVKKIFIKVGDKISKGTPICDLQTVDHESSQSDEKINPSPSHNPTWLIRKMF